jgi:hypothetical protein
VHVCNALTAISYLGQSDGKVGVLMECRLCRGGKGVEKLRHLTFGARQGRGEDNEGVNDVNDVEEARNQGQM